MNHRKYILRSREACVFLLIELFMPQISISYSILFKTEMNCSGLCTCHDNALENTMKLYNIKHSAVMGEKYRPELSYFDAKSEYMIFLGTFAPMLHRIAEITCDLSDGLSHSIMSLLNGVDEVMDTALEVKCRKGEDLIWDVPSWHTTFNIFVSEHCTIVTPDKQKFLVIPMNMWIVDIERGGSNIFDLVDIRFTMNTVTLSLTGSRASGTPRHWVDKYLVSASIINLQNNHLERYDCPLQFTKRLDTLNLEGNKMSQIPECVLDPNRVRLNYLSLAKNQISELTLLYDVPDSSLVPDVKIINLSFNLIRSIEAFRDMGNLTVLDLSHNAIKDITEDAFVNLCFLEVLYLGYNKIHMLGSNQFTSSLRLAVLDLSHNVLTTILPEQLPASSHPLALDMRHNRLISPPFRDCAKDTQVSINVKLYSAANPFFCDCQMIDFENCRRWVENSMINYSQKIVFVDLDSMMCATPGEMKDAKLSEISFHSKCIMIENCPPTCSCVLFNVERLVVNCSSRRLLEMPDTIPDYPNTSTVLFLDHNPLQMLSHRLYLRNLAELHVDNCLLTSVTPAAMASLQNIRVMTLHNNLLQKLPSSTRNITLNHARNITLHNNRWVCSCDSLWLPRWITKHKASMWMPGNIVCNYLRKPVEELSEIDLTCNSSSNIDTFLAISLALSSIISTLVIVICYRSEINVLLYSKLGLRLGYSFSYGDFFNPYDAFVSYSQDNYRWVVDTLVPHLENGPKKYRLCLHYRDFPQGESVIDNLPWAIRLSRCAVLVLSKDFLRKEWCIMEVRTAFQRLLLESDRLIIIATDDIVVDELSHDLRAYMNTHEYLLVGEPCFWDKLEMFFPPKPFISKKDVTVVMAKGGSGDSLQQQSTPDKFEETVISDLSDLSCRPTELIDF